MAPKTPTGVPRDPIILGDTWKWRIQDQPDFPFLTEAWSLFYELQGASYLHLPSGQSTIAYQTSGDDQGFWLVIVDPRDNSKLTPGRYRCWARMVGSGSFNGQEFTISDDWLVLIPNPRLDSPGAFQTHAEKMLAIIESEITARLTGSGSGHDSYQIEGRAIKKIDFDKLIGLRAKYAAMVNQEKTGKIGRRVYTGFTHIRGDPPNSYT